MVTVSDEQLLAAMLYVWERMKIVIEPTGALGIAGLLERRLEVPAGSRVGVILSGGNVDMRDVCRWIDGTESKAPD
jgi:threonine dehydratase